LQAYLLMTEGAKFHHGVHTVNISISAQNACFGSWWQQLLIDNIVGYDTILMNSLLNASGRGYLYNFQTKDLYNLNYLEEFGVFHHRSEGGWSNRMFSLFESLDFSFPLSFKLHLVHVRQCETFSSDY
jgi:hypothetical protein